MRAFDASKTDHAHWIMHRGTLSGNPIAAAAGLKTLEILRREGSYDRLRAIGARLQTLQAQALEAEGIPHRILGDETLFDVLFLDRGVRDYRDWQAGDSGLDARYNAELRRHGILKSIGKLYPSLAVEEEDFALTEEAVTQATAALRADALSAAG